MLKDMWPASRPAARILASSAYAEDVIESLIDRLLRIESLRGTGRLYLL
jgi:hypothetical protein